MAAHSFIQWGTGFNGTSLNEFYWGYRFYKEQTTVDGDRVIVPHSLSERQIQLG